VKNSPKNTRRLGFLLLSYTLVLIFILTFAPFSFHRPDKISIHWGGSPFDFVSNILLFIPPGFLYSYAAGRADKRAGLNVFLYGCLVSFAIEFTQIFLKDRYSSPLDVLTNGAGAWIGAFIHGHIRDRVRRRLIDKLFLELPLMTVIYLLLPLIWLDSLSETESAVIPWSLPLPGIVGAFILSALYIDRFRPHGLLSPNSLALLAGTVFFAAALPGLAANPLFIVASSLLITAVVRSSVTSLNLEAAGGKRFEAYLIRKVLPFYALYMLLQALLPVDSLTGMWQAGLGTGGDNSNIFFFKRVELVASFTL